MNDHTRSTLKAVLKEFSQFSYIAPDDIPDIPLYMDQITTFMDAKLSDCKRYPDEKILTKTMINNYAKNKLIPPPEKKKYSRDHILLLIYIYYLKDFLSISDIQTLLEPMKNKHFQSGEDPSLNEIYKEVFQLVKGQTGYMTKDLMRRWQAAESTFADIDEKDQEYLQLFSFICLLSFDVYVKKKLIEEVADEMRVYFSEHDKKDSGKQKTPD
ncbi:MAG: DUF1836 domain-containing protein [Lachnospiraceae bacterium]|nr:DUF1836 domain-containing protein [Lachnospiraceae bacterium]